MGYENLAHLRVLLEQGAEPKTFYEAALQAACVLSGAADGAILLPVERNPELMEAVVKTSGFTSDSIIPTMTGTHPVFKSYDIICAGAPLGSLVLAKVNTLPKIVSDELHTIAALIGVVFERSRVSFSTQLLHDRLQVLNEINLLIASNVNIQRIAKTLAREAAFRFSADAAFVLLINSDHDTLEPQGTYGCPPNVSPSTFAKNEGIFGQVLRIGGHLSVASLSQTADHELTFLENLGIISVDACALEVRGETLGVLLLGFRRDCGIGPHDLTRFEEFCQGSAVAIGTARTQERITAYTERLEELVGQRTQDLAIQTARAEEANQAKSRFLANMSHELRTPLTAIVGYSSVLADGIFGPMNEMQLDALSAVTRSSEHLKNLIDDVLNLARVESGKEAPEPKRISIEEALTPPFKLILQNAVNKGITIKPLELADSIKDRGIYADPKHLQQIILNLLSNAVKYTPSGGTVWLETSVVVDKVKIEVHDTGVGISEEKQAKLFERFERGEDNYSLSQEGTGIGLNLTKHLVEINGGRIGVESVMDKGSNFWIMMPLASTEAAVVITEEQSKTPQRLDGLTAMVVDDNTATVDVLSHILRAAGAIVVTANSVPESRELLREQTPDIVLTDIAMPGESGLALVQYLRDEKLLSIPIIVLSACAFQSDEEAALSAGASMFIAKPFKPADVVQSVRSLTFSVALNS